MATIVHSNRTQTELLPHFPILRLAYQQTGTSDRQIGRLGGVEITVYSNRRPGHTMSLASAVSGIILEFHKASSCSVKQQAIQKVHFTTHIGKGMTYLRHIIIVLSPMQ